MELSLYAAFILLCGVIWWAVQSNRHHGFELLKRPWKAANQVSFAVKYGYRTVSTRFTFEIADNALRRPYNYSLPSVDH